MKTSISSILFRTAGFLIKGAVIVTIGFFLTILLNDAYVDMKHAVYDAWCGR